MIRSTQLSRDSEISLVPEMMHPLNVAKRLSGCYSTPSSGAPQCAAVRKPTLIMRPFVFVGCVLGDVARRLYQTNTYEVLGGLPEPTFVVCGCHNPSALEFFRFHPNGRNLVVCDLGHIYMEFMRGPKMDGGEVNRRLFALCGLTEVQQLTKARQPEPLGYFHAPDVITSKGHVVLHPFGRGWGDWPPETCDVVRAALRAVPPSIRVFVVSADYVSTDGRTKVESFPCDLPNVTVLKNLSAPAAFTLVATASRFIGTMSALAQVAAFENTPSVILHPARCSDFKPPYSNYSKTIWNANGVAVPYDSIAKTSLEGALVRFLDKPDSALKMREDFRDVDPGPTADAIRT